MRVDELAPAPGSTKNKKRVGRGIGGKGGKTAGAGTKGQKSRGRGKVARGFEGGQMPLNQRAEVEGLQQPVPGGVQPSARPAHFPPKHRHPEVLVAAGLVRKDTLVKVLARGR